VSRSDRDAQDDDGLAGAHRWRRKEVEDVEAEVRIAVWDLFAMGMSWAASEVDGLQARRRVGGCVGEPGVCVSNWRERMPK